MFDQNHKLRLNEDIHLLLDIQQEYVLLVYNYYQLLYLIMFYWNYVYNRF